MRFAFVDTMLFPTMEVGCTLYTPYSSHILLLLLYVTSFHSLLFTLYKLCSFALYWKCALVTSCRPLDRVELYSSWIPYCVSLLLTNLTLYPSVCTCFAATHYQNLLSVDTVLSLVWRWAVLVKSFLYTVHSVLSAQLLNALFSILNLHPVPLHPLQTPSWRYSLLLKVNLLSLLASLIIVRDIQPPPNPFFL